MQARNTPKSAVMFSTCRYIYVATGELFQKAYLLTPHFTSFCLIDNPLLSLAGQGRNGGWVIGGTSGGSKTLRNPQSIRGGVDILAGGLGYPPTDILWCYYGAGSIDMECLSIVTPCGENHRVGTSINHPFLLSQVYRPHPG